MDPRQGSRAQGKQGWGLLSGWNLWAGPKKGNRARKEPQIKASGPLKSLGECEAALVYGGAPGASRDSGRTAAGDRTSRQPEGRCLTECSGHSIITRGNHVTGEGYSSPVLTNVTTNLEGIKVPGNSKEVDVPVVATHTLSYYRAVKLVLKKNI